ncbi:Uncharacterized protein HZ326_11647 [Fusarium oxysporum f. sp. albedinis]|nr:Uncharacterized protein HZ326_11647 [Fusarium oxysporum f. sp. albedinis]
MAVKARDLLARGDRQVFCLSQGSTATLGRMFGVFRYIPRQPDSVSGTHMRALRGGLCRNWYVLATKYTSGKTGVDKRQDSRSWGCEGVNRVGTKQMLNLPYSCVGGGDSGWGRFGERHPDGGNV